MTSRKSKKSARAQRAAIAKAPITVNVSQHIDARGVSQQSLPALQEIIAKAGDQTRRDIIDRLERGGFGSGKAVAPAATATRFWKVGSDGHALPVTAKDWEGVYDTTTGLIWDRRLLAGERNWKDAVKAASEATLCGAPARAPTIQERLSIVDYSRVEPALDIAFFDPKETSAWEWTSTPAVAPSGDAWYVGLGYGFSDRYYQSYHAHVRAVRAGQPIGL